VDARVRTEIEGIAETVARFQDALTLCVSTLMLYAQGADMGPERAERALREVKEILEGPRDASLS